jgi:cellulose synthase/poly-beta-1,6-N-acetylglucosamine synthase-like glycosyltransferase
MDNYSPAEVPYVWVLVPARNSGQVLDGCLKGLEGQTYPRDRFEIIVLNGQSHDNTAAIAQRHGVRVIQDEGKGRAAALNEGMKEVGDGYVAFTDPDCIPDTDWLRSLAAAFTSEEVGGAGGPNIVPGNAGAFVKAVEYVAMRSPHAKRFEQLGDAETLAGCNAMYPAAVLRKVFPLPEVGYVEDAILNCRVRKEGYRLMSTPGAIVWHRRHYSSPATLLSQMILFGRGVIQGGRLEKSLRRPLHAVFGVSLPTLIALLALGALLAPASLLVLSIAIALVSSGFSIGGYRETRSIRVSACIPLVLAIDVVGFSVGYTAELLSSRLILTEDPR